MTPPFVIAVYEFCIHLHYTLPLIIFDCRLDRGMQSATEMFIALE